MVDPNGLSVPTSVGEEGLSVNSRSAINSVDLENQGKKVIGIKVLTLMNKQYEKPNTNMNVLVSKHSKTISTIPATCYLS